MADKLCLISNPSRNPVVGPGPGQVSSKGNRQNVSSQIQNEPSKQCKYMFDVLIFVVEVLVKDQKEKNGEGKGGKYLEKENIWSVEEKEKGENI